MLKIVGKLPQENIGLALSGGVDSMTVAQFLLEGHKDFTAFHFNHGTEHSDEAEEFVTRWCDEHVVPLIKIKNPNSYNSNTAMLSHQDGSLVYKGLQDFYRQMRYKFFNSYPMYNIILAHHLDDVLETWLFSTFHGKAKLIPYRRDHMIRPFLKTSREEILDYAEHHDVEWIDDPSNDETDYMRNYIRHEIVPRVETVNPGIRKMLSRKIQAR